MSGPHPAVARIRTAVRAAVADLAPGALVLVACSGGPDSLALAAATAFVAGSPAGPPIRAGAVVVDHGLQSGSARVAAEAAASCRRLGLDPVLVRAVRVAGPGGPEAAARDARYAALAETADALGAAAVLLGHTRDDQAEGVLLGLARGSGARSLAGMPAVRGLLRRPLLGVPRADTEAACAALGLDPWQDPTNGLTAPAGPAESVPHGSAGATDLPLRSRVRACVLPVIERELGPGVRAALARTAEQLREDGDALDALAGALADRAISIDDGSLAEAVTPEPADPDSPAPPPAHPTVRVDLAMLAEAPTALRRRVLRIAAHAAGSPPGALTRTHLLAIDALVTDWRGQGPIHLPGRVRATRGCGRLSLHAAPADGAHPEPPGDRSALG